MIPNCEGCQDELEEGIKWFNNCYDVCFDGLGERKHLFIVVFDKKGKIILF